MSASEALPHGIYEALLCEELRGLLDGHPELRPVFGKIDDGRSTGSFCHRDVSTDSANSAILVWAYN